MGHPPPASPPRLAGALLLDLVQEFLEWADLRFTANVFGVEAACGGASLPRRGALAAKLVRQGVLGSGRGGARARLWVEWPCRCSGLAEG